MIRRRTTLGEDTAGRVTSRRNERTGKGEVQTIRHFEVCFLLSTLLSVHLLSKRLNFGFVHTCKASSQLTLSHLCLNTALPIILGST